MFLPHFSKTSPKIISLTSTFFIQFAIEALLPEEALNDLPNIEQLRPIEFNPHNWLTTDILQIHTYQNQFFQNSTLNKQTKEQIRIHFL